MKLRNFLTGAAVAAVLAASGSANAQLLGGGATGGLGGSVTGGLGNIGATGSGTLNGSVRGTTDALGRTREIGSRATDGVKDSAARAKDQAESAAEGAEATASGALDSAVSTAEGATDAVSATADLAGNASGDVSGSPPSRRDKPVAPQARTGQARCEAGSPGRSGRRPMSTATASLDAKASADAGAQHREAIEKGASRRRERGLPSLFRACLTRFRGV